MDEQCSIGQIVSEVCHKTVYGSVLKNLKNVNDFDEDRQTLFKLRVSSSVSSVCEYHEKKYILKYNHIFGKKCSDPLKVHKKPVIKGLREIKLEHLSLLSESKTASQVELNVIPGNSLCPNCYSKIFIMKPEPESCNLVNDIYIPNEEAISKLDFACSNLEVSPASKIRKLSSGKRKVAIESKVQRISDKIRKDLESCFNNADTNSISKKEENLPPESSDTEYLSLIEKLKSKCSVTPKEEKVKILSLLPDSWSREKIVHEFNVSDRLVRLTQKLVKEQGILPVLGKKKGVGISEETTEKIQQFFEDDENNRICPDSKRVVTNGVKVTKQK